MADPDHDHGPLALLVAALSTRADQDWALYGAHRERLTDVVAQSSRMTGAAAVPGEVRRLCVLGAGHCNDLDLERLAESFAEIHLVDIDGPALARAVARQPSSVRARVHRHGDVDLSGLSRRRLARWKRIVPDAGEIETAANAALDAILTKIGGSFDVVASTCVLTQMAFALREALGERHPALEAVRFALMRTHLSTLVGLTSPGGVALFASDVVSSTTYPLAEPSPGRTTTDLLHDVVSTGAAYFAANPELVAGLLAEVGSPELLEPWLWTGPLARTYLVYALRVHLPIDAES
ncbi:MAG TPA: hypothetical protein VGK52_15360 [Polyangia bacterium]